VKDDTDVALRPALKTSNSTFIDVNMRDPALHAEAAQLEKRWESSPGGRPRMNPAWAYILYGRAVQVLGGARHVEEVFADATVWRQIRQLSRKLPGVTPAPEEPMRRHHFKYFMKRFGPDAAAICELGRVHREQACALAHEAGHFNQTGRARINPTFQNSTTGDGKVISARRRHDPKTFVKDPVSGAWVSPSNPDIARYIEGGGPKDYEVGTKFLFTSTRSEFGAIELDVAHVKGSAPTAEAKVQIEVLRDLRPLLPGPFFHIHDGALIGSDSQTLLTELGIIQVNKIRAAAAAKNGKPRKADEGLVEHQEFTRPDGGTELIKIYQVDGRFGILVATEDGDRFLPLELVKLQVNENKRSDAKRYRGYVELKLPDDIATRIGTPTVRTTLHQTTEDSERGYNRGAHVRAIGPGSESFEAIYPKLRNYRESYNRVIEDAQYRSKRAHADSSGALTLHMLFLTGAINAMTRARMEKARIGVAA
jgi:hypothetical protein